MKSCDNLKKSFFYKILLQLHIKINFLLLHQKRKSYFINKINNIFKYNYYK